MKKIINVLTKEEVSIDENSLPVLIHAKEHSGGSLLAVTIAAQLHSAGNKLYIFTAYPMAKEEFLKQISDPNQVFYIENESAFSEAEQYQTIIVQSGNVDLFLKGFTQLHDIRERVIFIKNIETINQGINQLLTEPLLVCAGDLEGNPLQEGFKEMNYHTKILFAPLLDIPIPTLEKYQAYMKTSDNTEQVISLL